MASEPGRDWPGRELAGRLAVRPQTMLTQVALLRGRAYGAPLTLGEHCRPSGPDGEGQARGQARSTRGETSFRAAVGLYFFKESF